MWVLSEKKFVVFNFTSWQKSLHNGDLIFSFGVNNYNQVLGAGIQFDINLTQAFKKMLDC